MRLHVDLTTLQSWLSGADPVPDYAFLDAVDVITVAKLRAESLFIAAAKKFD